MSFADPIENDRTNELIAENLEFLDENKYSDFSSRQTSRFDQISRHHSYFTNDDTYKKVLAF